jgi:hypothetical protein
MGFHKKDSNENIKYFFPVKVTQNMWWGLVFVYIISFSTSIYSFFHLSYICLHLWGLRMHFWSMGTHRADSVHSDDRVTMMIVSRGHLQLNVGCEQFGWQGALHSSHSWSFTFKVAKFFIWERKNMHTDLIREQTRNPLNEDPVSCLRQ